MRRRSRTFLHAATATGLALLPSFVGAQAFTPPKGLGSITLAWQYVSNTGHRLTDGYFSPSGQSVTTSALLEVDYAFTDRFALSAGLPYVFAKYTGKNEPFSGLPIDTCRCWQSSFQDFSLTARYRFGDEVWAVTPMLRVSLPSHDYDFRGEAVVGRDLSEAQVGVLAARRLTGLLFRATVQAGYTYAFVETPLPDVPIDRSNGFLDLGYALGRSLYLRSGVSFQTTHGGLRFGSVTGNPFPPPGEVNTPARNSQRDRLLRANYWQAGAGLSYSLGAVDVFASFSKYVWGRDAHNGRVFGLGATWYFDRSR